MILFAAMDLKAGRCVRLEQGRADRETIFHHDPAAQARTFVGQGFRFLHIVDLDGAFSGGPGNAAAVTAILDAVKAEGEPVRVQLGGGIRSLSMVEDWLARGVDRVILGTAAIRDPAMTQDACRRFPGRIVVALDARDGQVALEGWTRASPDTLHEAARRVAGFGPAALLYTDIARDGMLTGLNIEGTCALAQAVGIPVIASGGLSGLDDLIALRAAASPGIANPGIEGVIAGRALYDGRLDPIRALAALA